LEKIEVSPDVRSTDSPGYLAPLRQPRNSSKATSGALFNLSASLAKEGAVAPFGGDSVIAEPNAFEMP
jgi:hypothetical protein